MFASVVLLLAFVGVTLAKLDIETSTAVPHVKITPMAGAVVVNGFSQANNLTMACNNKFCEMLKYTVTCKSLNLGMKKICAIHLLGYKYGCDAFPPPSDVVKAPSICIPSALKIVKPIKDLGPAVVLAAILGPYLDPQSFVADNCDRHCFQNLQYASHDFYSTCRPQLNKLIPIALLQSGFQEYRNQACARNPSGQNCYVSIMSLIPKTTSSSSFRDLFAGLQGEKLSSEDEYMQAEVLEQFKTLLADDEPLVPPGAIEASIPSGLESPFVSGSNVQLQDAQEVTVAAATDAESRRALQTGATNDIFNFKCNYTSGTTVVIPGVGPAPSNVYNTNFKNGICQKLKPMGCCAATGLTMIQQNPISSLPALAAGTTADPTIFPPCLYRYLQDTPTCALNLQNYCTNGSIASNTVNRGVVTVPYLAPNNIPNMYIKMGVLTVQAVIQFSLKDMGYAVWPYLFSNPLQIQIVDYAYGTGIQSGAPVIVTPTDGSMAVPYGSDYAAANTAGVGGFGQFTFQIVNQDLNATTSAILFSALNSAEFKEKVSYYLTSFQSGTAVQTNIIQAPVIFEPTPLVFENAAGSVSAHKGMQWLVTLGLTLGASVMLMKSAAV